MDFKHCCFLIWWIPGVLSQGLKRGRSVTLTTHPHLVSRMSRSYTSSLQSAFMACGGAAIALDFWYGFFRIPQMDFKHCCFLIRFLWDTTSGLFWYDSFETPQVDYSDTIPLEHHKWILNTATLFSPVMYHYVTDCRQVKLKNGRFHLLVEETGTNWSASFLSFNTHLNVVVALSIVCYGK
jgi:hypothetical protein